MRRLHLRLSEPDSAQRQRARPARHWLSRYRHGTMKTKEITKAQLNGISVVAMDARFRELQLEGSGLDHTPVRDTPWGTREFHVRDPDGNGLQFFRDR